MSTGRGPWPQLRGVMAAAAFAVVGMAVAPELASKTTFTVALALLLVFITPGYTLAAALLPRASLGTAERLTVVLGLSISAAVLTGLVLDQLPGGLRGESWVIALGVVTLLSSAVAAGRMKYLGGSVDKRGGQLSDRHAAILGLAGVVAVGAVLLGRAGAIEDVRGAEFAQLWIEPGRGSRSDSVRVGVTSTYQGVERYRLKVSARGRSLGSRRLTLAPGESLEMTLRLRRPPAAAPLRAVLYRAAAPARPARTVTLRSSLPALRSGDG